MVSQPIFNVARLVKATLHANKLVTRCLELAAQLIARDEAPNAIERGGRKAHDLHMETRSSVTADTR